MDALKRLLATLDGKKSYLGLIAAGTLGLLWTSGMVSDKTAEVLGVLIGTWTGISFRSAIGKAQTSQDADPPEPRVRT